MGTAISDEARAWYNVAGNLNNVPLTMWAPNINLHRNFLWGRAVETPGEDPVLNGRYAAEFIAAMQGNVTANDWDKPGAALLKTAPTIKHFAAYDLECSSGGQDQDFFGCDAPGVDRFHFDAQIPQEDLVEYYLAVFEAPIKEAVPASIMCSFNSINSEPSCSSDMLMNRLARGEWGFEGFTVSDCGGVPAINTAHYMTGSPAQAVARALHGGLDAECGMNPPNSAGYYFQKRGADALQQGLINASTIDQALVRKWRTALRLGLFQQSTPWDHLGKETIHSAEHVALALSAAEQSMTLLKNLKVAANHSNSTPPLGTGSTTSAGGSGGSDQETAAPPVHCDPNAFPTEICPSGAPCPKCGKPACVCTAGPTPGSAGHPMLPLREGQHKKIALIGPGLDLHGGDMQGPYSGQANVTSILDALRLRFGPAFSTTFVSSLGTPGGDGSNSTALIPAAVSVVEQGSVELVLLCVNDQFVSEGSDRTDTRLYYGQAQLIERVAAVGKPVVLVVIAGHTLDLTFAKAHPAVKAILWAYLPSEQGGPAIVNTLFGDAKPAGRLPFTIYPANITAPGQRPDPTDMSLRSGSGVTHLHYTGTPVYEFGFGLTYSAWRFEWHRPPPQTLATESDSNKLSMTVRVTNVGATDSEIVVPAYVRAESLHAHAFHPERAVTPPVRELFDFQRVFCAKGESVLVRVELGESVLALADRAGVLAVRPGKYTVSVGGHPSRQQQQQEEEEGQEAVTASFVVAGSPRTVFSLEDL
jgi:beta-glucosidase-like glycosyl hydrolase